MASQAWTHWLVSVEDQAQSAPTILVGLGEMRQEDPVVAAEATQAYLVARETLAAWMDSGWQARQLVVEQVVEMKWEPQLVERETHVEAVKR